MKNRFHRFFLLTTLSALFVGFTVESEAGTRFSNRKSKTYGHARSRAYENDSKKERPRLRLFSRLTKKKSTSSPAPSTYTRTPIPRSATAETVVKKTTAKKKPGLLARIFGKKDSNRQVSTRTSRSAKPKPPTSSVKINHSLLAGASRSSSRVVVDISKQRAYLLVNGKIAVNSPVSTARPGKHTPRGTFTITQRVPTGKISTIYGVHMPYWMRLGGSAYGMHAGYLPGYPASAGCIRLPSDGAQAIFSHTRSGTRVSIYSSWRG